MAIPPVNSLGLRETVNLGISDDEKVWHFRSAWNVAALNCLDPQYQPILDAYSRYIKDHARPLKQVNDRIDAEYRQEYGRGRPAIMARESQMTMVYNYFALPPARSDFCRTALGISQQYLASEKVDPAGFALANFSALEGPFERFFVAYEQYQRESSAWDARYGDRYGDLAAGLCRRPERTSVPDAAAGCRSRIAERDPAAGNQGHRPRYRSEDSDRAGRRNARLGARRPADPQQRGRGRQLAELGRLVLFRRAAFR
ncbi:hypothetical protein SD421_13875 [Qipengyuania sp. HL-TH1]|uniref:hypothetical protein n=1 Tax=Qipengyuania profunda TaxID=3113984 RepID=UPI002A1874D0|nr:hypothetical protein [Qipengyuania sp. HL-TH1]WPL56520.1 hypothetical protein SD421_13875 [Qipengyuania sp. HL-TH5]